MLWRLLRPRDRLFHFLSCFWGRVRTWRYHWPQNTPTRDGKGWLNQSCLKVFFCTFETSSSNHLSLLSSCWKNMPICFIGNVHKKTWALTRMKVLANFLAEDTVSFVTWWACLTCHTFPLGAVQNLATVRLVETRVGTVVQTKVDWLVNAKNIGKGVSCDIGLEQACHLGIFMNIRDKLKAKNLKLRISSP